MRPKLLPALLATLAMTAPVLAQTDTPFTATIHIDGKVINTLRPEIFGDNIEWTHNGMRFWNSTAGALDPHLVDLTKTAGVTHLRYPGGTLSDFFHWRMAVGGDRKQQPNPFENGAPEDSSFGPDEFMSLCRRLRIQAYITLNAGTGTPDEAAAWVRYNVDHHYPVSAYEVGNEVYMTNVKVPGQPNIDLTPQQYIHFYQATYQAIRTVSPTAKIGAVGVVDTGPIPLQRDPHWTQDILKSLGGEMDFLAVHNSYAPGMRPSGITPGAERYPDDIFAGCLLAAPVAIAHNFDATKALIRRECPNDYRHIDIHVTESGPFIVPVDKTHIVQDVAWNTNLTAALYEAEILNMFACEPKITSVNHLPLCQNYFGALIGIDDAGRTWRNAVYYVFKLYSGLRGGKVMACTVDAPTYNVPKQGFASAMHGIPLVDAGVYRTGPRTLRVIVVNRSISRDASVRIDGIPSRYRVTGLTRIGSPSFLDRNTADDPNRVTPKSEKVSGAIRNTPLIMKVPCHSLASIEIVEAGR